MVLFKDRAHAGGKLAEKLAEFQTEDAIILAIPRGGVVVAAEVARRLKAPLDIIIPKKIGAPGDPELAVGAVTPDGYTLWNQLLIHRLGLSEQDMEDRIKRTIEEITRRLSDYRGKAPLPDLGDRDVILVDDGIATGFTVKAALRSIRRHGPGRTVLAVPVAPADTLADLANEVDCITCLATPEPFFSVGQFYRDFEQTSDAEVKRLLARYGVFEGSQVDV